MSNFIPFVSEFSKYRDSVNWQYSHDDTRCYGWRISNSAKEDFVAHLETEWPEAPDNVKSNFNSMFQNENDLLGIQVLGTCLGNKVYLLKATEKKKIFSLSSFGCFGSNDIYTPQKLSCPVTNKKFLWPMSIKPSSIIIKDSVREYYDVGEKRNWGLITFDMDKYPLNNLYISGKVNYKTGLFLLERYSKVNEDQYDILLKKQSAGGSSSVGGAASSSVPTVIYKKNVDNIQFEFVVYENPVKIVWEYEISN